MLKGLMLGSTAVAMLTLNTPVAHAGEIFSRCALVAVAQRIVTGSLDTYVGAAVGVAVFDDDATHTLRCYVQVDGVEQSSTQSASGRSVVVTADQVTYNAPQASLTELCKEIDAVPIGCAAVSEHQVPPHDLVEALQPVLTALEDAMGRADAILCPILVLLAPGVPGIVDITPEGDISIAALGGKVWDCPPYDGPWDLELPLTRVHLAIV